MADAGYSRLSPPGEFHDRSSIARPDFAPGVNPGSIATEAQRRQDGRQGLTSGSLESASADPITSAARGVGGLVLAPLALVGNILSAATTGRTLAENRTRHEIEQKQLRAALTQRNLANVAQGLGIASELAKNVASIGDQDQRAAAQAQAEALFAEDMPGLVPVFHSLVKNSNANVAFGERKTQLANVTKYSKTFQNWATLTGADPSKLSDAMKQQIIEETSIGQAREYIAKGRPIVKRLLRRFQEESPERAAQMRESDQAMTVDEFFEVLSRYQRSEPDVSDPAVRSNLVSSVERFPESFGLRPTAEVAARRADVATRSKAVNVLLPDGTQVRGRELPDGQLQVATASGFQTAPPTAVKAPTPTTVVNLKGAKQGIFEQVREETGDARLAAAAVSRHAYREPILGQWVFGSDQDRRRAAGRKAFFSAIQDLRNAAQDVAETHRDTDVLSEIYNSVQRGLSSGDPVIERYEQARNGAVLVLQEATTGKNASERELQRLLQQFPSLRSLAKDGKVTPTAERLFNGLEQRIINEHVASFPVEQQPEVEQKIRGLLPELHQAGQPDVRSQVVSEAEAQLAAQLGRQPTPEEIAQHVRELSRGSP